MTPEAGRRDIVLIVDDSPDTLAMLIEALEGGGVTTLIARDGLAALAILDRVAPDLVLLDAVMPGIDGFETCRRMKARPDMATTPIVFMTGLSEPGHVLEGLRAGGVDYVTKPIDPDVLLARIAVHLANARLIADARAALDAAGRAVAAFAPDGTLVWASPRAQALLAQAGVGAPPAGMARWLAGAALSGGDDADFVLAGAAGALRLSPVGRSSAGDLLARVRPAEAEAPGVALARALGVSEREGEVLGWIARGKSNRDIAEILGLSPRTVTKHVEQIFAKLGVENRTAAAAMCLRRLD